MQMSHFPAHLFTLQMDTPVLYNEDANCLPCILVCLDNLVKNKHKYFFNVFDGSSFV